MAFLTIFLSVVVESLPFLVIGTLIATIAQRFKLFDLCIARLPRQLFLRRLSISLLGILMPVCECGNVPLTRTLIQKGFTTAEATTFLLAAPILNPITFITTKEAFRGVFWMAPARMLSGLLIALIVGQLVGNVRHPITEAFQKKCQADHGSDTSFSLKFADEFWQLSKLLIIGAFIAAFVQSVISHQTLANAAANYASGVLIMLGFGIIISICSNVDAFFALSFAGSFRYGALLTFLLVGPLVDIKTITMLTKTYRLKAIMIMVGTVALIGLLIGLGVSYVR